MQTLGTESDPRFLCKLLLCVCERRARREGKVGETGACVNQRVMLKKQTKITKRVSEQVQVEKGHLGIHLASTPTETGVVLFLLLLKSLKCHGWIGPRCRPVRST